MLSFFLNNVEGSDKLMNEIKEDVSTLDKIV